jgi:UDP-3-O-[3-hydroxymyristoyl] N-acetylglucosamine deacetylase
LARPVSVAGTGLHSGTRSRVRLLPASADHGIVLRVRRDGDSIEVPATWRHRVPSPLCTALDLGDTRKFRTIEHVMASLAGLGIDNAILEVDGQEMPIFDGSARRWCALLREAGIERQPARRRRIRVLKPVQVSSHGRFVRAEPHDGFSVDVTFDQIPGFGGLRWSGEITPEVFEREIAAARSFGQPWQFWDRVAARSRVAAAIGRALDAEKAVQRLLGRRAPRENHPANSPVAEAESPLCEPIYRELHHRKVDQVARDPVLRGIRPWRVAVITGGTILGGRRYPDEPVRHVALDLVGDLFLAGSPFLGHFVAHRPTHESTYVLVRALLETPDAWTYA